MKYATHWPIVRYSGTKTDYHGVWWVAGTGARYTLKCWHGLTLVDVRPANVTLIEVPPLTPARAEALRWLLRGHDRVPPLRARRWLIGKELAEEVDGRTRVTEVGRELAAAINWYELH